MMKANGGMEANGGAGAATSGWRIAAWSLAAALWLLPLAAMQVTDEVNWTAGDFVFAGVLIGGVGLALELAVRGSRDLAWRGGVALLLAAAFLLVWINAAVGIIGDEGDPLNLVYAGVLAVALVGAIVARFRARGMVRATAAAAVAQALAGAVAVATAGDQPPGPLGQVVLNGGFVLLFAGSAWLFARAAARTAR